MKRPLGLIVGGAMGAFLIAMVGVSAHTGGLPLLSMVGVQHSQHGDEASGSRTEPSESPEASPETEPTEKPEPGPSARPSPTSEANDFDENDGATASPSPTCTPGEEGGDEGSRCGTQGGGGGD